MYIRKRTIAATILGVVVVSSATTAWVIKQYGQTPAIAINGNQAASADFQKFYNVYNMLKDKYVDQETSQTLINGAINGMVQSLNDPFTSYMDPTAASKFQEMVSSSFEGIGAVMQQQDSSIIVSSVMKDSPAEKSGLKAQDIILRVDGKSLDGETVDTAANMIRGKKGTKVELDVKRPSTNQEIHLTITRAQITEDTVFSKKLADGNGYIQITQFSTDTAASFEKQLKSLQDSGVKGLVIDLRQNPGGLLDSVKQIAGDLLPKGKIMYQVQSRDGTKVPYQVDKGGVNLPIVALVDGGSASAAEILSAALNESGGYPLVGEKTFGKGTVQTTQTYDDGSSVKYTIAKWLTPDGNWIHKKGIMPQYVVHLPSYFSLPPIKDTDTLKYDTNNDEVKSAQQFLAALGFDPGRQDGYYSKQTEQAVMNFESAKSLPADGVLTGKASDALMQAITDKMKTDDTQLKMAQEVLEKEISSRK